MENPKPTAALLSSCLLCLGFAAQPALADDDSELKAKLEGVQEVPSVITGASGRFKAELNESSGMIEWELRYEGLEGGNVLQAHIHVGQRGVNGGIVVFLCSNLPSPPAGTQACPPPPAHISGTITAANVLPQLSQGVSAGEFSALVRALKKGVAYANVHTAVSPGGEIRGQIRVRDDD